MKLASAIALIAGGPGSGCRGDNCGRKSMGDDYATWTQEEKNRDWANRNGLPIDGSNRVRLYHATPLQTATAISNEGLRANSFLATDPSTALQQAGRDRGLKAGKLALYEAWVPLGKFWGGVWAQLQSPLSAAELSLKRINSRGLKGGGTGSGCHGPNCGRKSSGNTVEKVTGLQDSAAIEQALLVRSARGGAWVAVVPPFSQPGDPIELHRYSTPSSIPDHYLDASPAMRERGVAWKGRFVVWPKSTVRKDQRKGYSGDR